MEIFGGPVIHDRVIRDTNIFAAGSGFNVANDNGDAGAEVRDGLDACLGRRSLTMGGPFVFAGTDRGEVYINSS